MAETKKKAAPKKKASPSKKSNTNAKTSNKKVTKTPAKKANNKSVKKDSKAVNKKAVNKKPIQVKSKKNNDVWKLLSILLLVIVIVLGGLIIDKMVKAPEPSSDDEESDSENNEQLEESNEVKLLVIEDPECETCNVDIFTGQIKQNLINDLEIEKISFEENRGESVIATTGQQYVPIYLFTKNIDEIDEWESSLKGAFVLINVLGDEYYLLNPQVVQGKILIEDPVILDNAIIMGNPDADVTLYEFSDYECPFCAIAEGSSKILEEFKVEYPDYIPTIPKIYEEYVETGKIRYVFYNFPLENLHPNAKGAHNAALCANEQDSWKKYHDVLFEERDSWIGNDDSISVFKEIASDLSLDQTEFDNCLDEMRYDAQINEELKLGISYGVTGTPAFFINKYFIPGAQNYNTIKEVIEYELNR